MSGIAGLVRLDGAPFDGSPGLREAISHRGPDGASEWVSGSAAFFHSLLRTTPEDSGVFVSGDVVVTADARIDETGGEAVAGLGKSHPALIAEAWKRWGEDCPSHLEGDFAFALWDVRTRTLFCARDPFGVKAFYFALLPERLFVFASEPHALFAVDEVPRAIDEQRIADFLDLRFVDLDRTFHRDVKRLPGGCALVLRDGRMTVRRYWSPRNVKPLRLRGGDAAYAEGYCAHFARAVRERMRVAEPSQLGAMLSGGLDSSAIACVARDQLRDTGGPALPVVSWIFSDAMEADEREFQEPVIAAGGVRPLTLDSAHVSASPWTDLDLLLPDGPPYAPNFYLNTEVAKLARSQGIRVLLDGLGGDVTVSRGSARFLELFTRGRIFTLARELRALASRRGTSESLARLFAANVALPLAPASLLRGLSRLRGRQYGAPRRFLTVHAEHLDQLESPFLAEGLELFDRMLARFGVEGRYPFFDRRLAEYCLSLPADQKLADGYSRMVARRAMAGILPDAVRLRAGKGAPGLHILPALRARSSELEELFAQDASAVGRWVDVAGLRRTYDGLMAGRPVDLKAVVRLWNAALVGRWLRGQSGADKPLVASELRG
jgi:asparagine synthase (glutamine-hydrolysing)